MRKADRVPLVRMLMLVHWVWVAACEPVDRSAEQRPAAATQNGIETVSSTAAQSGVGADEIKEVAEYLRETRFAQADLRRGELLSLACQACHTFDAGQRHGLGPNLYRIFGRRAGSADGFEYSEVLGNSDLIWTPEALEAWLAEPSRFLAGNNMAFAGYRSETDRGDLLAYLMRATSAAP